MTHMVAGLDTTPAQFTADLVLVFLVALNAYLGWRFGLLRRVLSLIGLYVACLAATNVGNAVASAVKAGSLSANAWAFIAVLAVVVVTFEILGFLFNDKIQKVAVVLFNRVAGMITGALLGIAQALVLFLVAYAVANAPASAVGASHDRAATADAIQSATLAGQAVRMTPEVNALFAPVLPDDLARHLSEGVHVVTPPV